MRPIRITIASLLLAVPLSGLGGEGEAALNGPRDPGDSTPSRQETESAETRKERRRKRREDPTRYRLLPVPIFITEPAIGNGLGVALALFHPVKGASAPPPMAGSPSIVGQVDESSQPPPVVTAVAGAYTSNETWMAGIGHANHWRDDTIRYKGGAGKMHVNADFYLLNFPIPFTVDGWMVYQDAKFRLGKSKFFVGGALTYLDFNARFRFGLDAPPLPEDRRFSRTIKDVGMAVNVSYESRDNVTYPRAGSLVQLSATRHDEGLGGDYDYWSVKLKALLFRPLAERLTLGLRLEASVVDGNPPFFGYPWVSLRGIPAMRYQNKLAGATEAELRYRIAERWEALGFAGLGFTTNKVDLFDPPGNIYSFGAGLRYQILPSHGIWGGIDVARGPEETTWYIQVGHPW